MSTIQVIGIDPNRYSNLQENSHIQTQTRGGTIFSKGSKNHLQLKTRSHKLNHPQNAVLTQFIAQKPNDIEITKVTKGGPHPTTNKTICPQIQAKISKSQQVRQRMR